MSLTNTFREVAIANAAKQAIIIDNVTEDAPCLRSLPMQAATHGLWNVYEEVISATGPNLVDLDSALGAIDASSELKQVNLSAIAGLIEVGEDKARQFGGAERYVETKMPAVLRKAGADVENSMFYNNFRAYAAAHGKLVDAGGTGSANYSMLCIKFADGENTGLYSPNGLGRGIAFDLQWLGGGTLYKNSSGIAVYGMRIKSYFGIQLANPKTIAGIVNIDLTEDLSTTTGHKALPSMKQMNDMIANARGTGQNTVIWCHPKVITALGIYKPLIMNVQDTNLKMVVAMWNDVPIIGSYNWDDGTETKVTV